MVLEHVPFQHVPTNKKYQSMCQIQRFLSRGMSSINTMEWEPNAATRKTQLLLEDLKTSRKYDASCRSGGDPCMCGILVNLDLRLY